MDSDSIALVTSAKAAVGSKHQVVFPNQNPYGDALLELYSLEIRLCWLYRSILLFNRTYDYQLPAAVVDTFLNGQGLHSGSARVIKKLLVRQRVVPEFPRTPMKKTILLALYSACALPCRVRNVLVTRLARALEGHLRRKYSQIIAKNCSIPDRCILEGLAEQSQRIFDSLS